MEAVEIRNRSKLSATIIIIIIIIIINIIIIIIIISSSSIIIIIIIIDLFQRIVRVCMVVLVWETISVNVRKILRANAVKFVSVFNLS